MTSFRNIISREFLQELTSFQHASKCALWPPLCRIQISITMNLWPTRGCLLAQEAATTEASGEVAVAWRSKGRPPGAGRGAEAAIHMEKSLGEETEWRSDLFVRSGSV
jgi:hypothetical protein